MFGQKTGAATDIENALAGRDAERFHQSLTRLELPADADLLVVTRQFGIVFTQRRPSPIHGFLLQPAAVAQTLVLAFVLAANGSAKSPEVAWLARERRRLLGVESHIAEVCMKRPIMIALLSVLPLAFCVPVLHAEGPDAIDASKMPESGPAVVGGTGQTIGPNSKNQAVMPMPGLRQDEELSERMREQALSVPEVRPVPGAPTPKSVRQTR
jgi:hypothetical protein